MADLQEMRRHIVDELTPARNWKARGNGADGYVCPLCGSGGRGTRDSDGALSVKGDGVHWHCFSCDQGGDIYDLFMLRDNLTASEAAAAVLRKYGDGRRRSSGVEDFRLATTTSRRDDQQRQQAEAQPLKDYGEYVARCHAALKDSPGAAYFTGRGLTPATLERWNLGFDVQRRNVVIPYPGTPNSYYTARTISGEKRYFKPPTDDAGHEPLFNAGALYSGADTVFIVEAQLCAISIEQAGGAAVAIGGSGAGKLLAAVKERATAAALIVCLDNDPHELDDKGRYKDETTREKARKLTDDLRAAGCTVTQDNSICGSAKDPNDALQADAGAFAAAIRRAADIARGTAQAEADAARVAYQQQNAAGFMDAFGKTVKESANTPPIPTGFPGLDKNLGGGLFEGLYVIGAISSLGKTSWTLQICDQVAEVGTDVLIFSLEMSKYEMIAKSISRLTFQHTQRVGIGREYARTTRGVTNGANYARYSERDFDVLDAAEQRYRTQIGPRVWIFEGIGNIGVGEVRAAVKRHFDLTGRRPVIVCDYLQILAPYIDPAHPNRALTDKQCVDKNVLELKRISRDYKIPVIAISSFNRDNYSAPVNTAAFKESGAVEYSADVLIGVQYHGMERQEKGNGKAENDNDPERLARVARLMRDNDTKAKAGKGVMIDVKILKNRNGGRGMSDTMTFYPMFNTFDENTGGFTPVDEDISGVFDKKRR